MSQAPLRLLLVEDSEADATLLLRALRRDGYEVQARRVDAEAAFLEALGEKDSWDLVISDYSLPQFSGPRALALFVERGLDIPFLVVSGAVGEDAAAALMKSGASDFVTKGNLVRVAPAVRRALEEVAVRLRERRAAAEKQELQTQLLQAQKMEAIGALTAGVAHDFNNILGAIQIYADLAQIKSASGASLEGELQQIVKSVERAAGLARQLLLFSRKQPLALAPLDVGRTVEDLLKMLRRIIGERIEVCTAIDPGCRTVIGDVGGIEQVVMNLAVNARDAMPQGGRLTIGVGNVEIVAGYCRGVLGARPGPFVRLFVQDTGCGMDAGILDRIFEPFFTTKAAGEGTGLGLSVVYGIVQQHRGWITVRSSPGAGSRFEVFLPPAGAGGEAGPGEPVATELAGRGERVLLVEDEDGYRAVAAEALAASGYEVQAAAGVDEAERLLRASPGSFDLLFSDVALGDGNGFDLAVRVRAMAPGIKVLLTSGYTDETSQLGRIRAAGLPFIAKPYALSALLATISDLMRKPVI